MARSRPAGSLIRSRACTRPRTTATFGCTPTSPSKPHVPSPVPACPCRAQPPQRDRRPLTMYADPRRRRCCPAELVRRRSRKRGVCAKAGRDRAAFVRRMGRTSAGPGARAHDSHRTRQDRRCTQEGRGGGSGLCTAAGGRPRARSDEGARGACVWTDTRW